MHVKSRSDVHMVGHEVLFYFAALRNPNDVIFAILQCVA